MEIIRNNFIRENYELLDTTSYQDRKNTQYRMLLYNFFEKNIKNM